MTTFKIPEGKVVDRIELDAGEGRATLNVIYKEEKPKEEKRVAVLCETKEPTGIYLSNLTGELVVCGLSERPDPTYYVPMAKAEAGEFVVLPTEALDEILVAVANEINELCDTLRASSGHGGAVMVVHRHWQILHKLLSERK